MVIIQDIVDYCTQMIANGGYFFGFFLTFLESYLPFLPLSVFVALNVNAFGFLLGCFISWLGTCTGSYTCYLLFRLLESKLTEKFLNRKTIKKIHNALEKFNNIKFTELVLLLTLPFTPSCLVNILAGITNMSKDKYLWAIAIGKSFTILFWGYLGKSVIKNITDLKSLIYIIITLLLAYIISKLVSHKWNIE